MARADPVRAFLVRCIEQGFFPGAAWGVWRPARGTRIEAVGHRIVTGPVLPALRRTLFDLASLTKPLCTAYLCLTLESQGRLALDEPVAPYLPELGSKGRRLTILDLLAHRSGLPAWRPLYLGSTTKADAMAAIGRTRAIHTPRTSVVYSDLNYILLGVYLERLLGNRLARLFEERVAKPLALPRLLFLPPRSRRLACAATERGNGRERAMAGSAGSRWRGWRRAVIWGQVHDHNAHCLGGDLGHAGLFGDVASCLSLARRFLELPACLSDRTRGMKGHRTAGFQLATDPGSSAGPALSPRSIGHTGFTGTSLWIDPERPLILCLLTNRVHPERSGCDMHAVRREFHRLAADLRPGG